MKDKILQIAVYVGVALLVLGGIYARYKVVCNSNWDCMYADKVVYIKQSPEETQHRLNGEL